MSNKGGPKYSPEIVNKRREEIRDLLEEVGSWNVKLKPLAEKYGVSVGQISHDLTHIKKNLKIPGLKEITLNAAYAYRKAVKEMYAILGTGNKKEKMEAARALSSTMESFTKFLEDFKLKEKVAEKLDIDHKQISVYFDINPDEYPELKEYAKKRIKNQVDQPKTEEVHREQ